MEDLVIGIYVSSAILLFLTGMSTALRCYVRIRLLKAFAWDDILMILALVRVHFFLGLCFPTPVDSSLSESEFPNPSAGPYMLGGLPKEKESD
jgi:hypothetical protein